MSHRNARLKTDALVHHGRHFGRTVQMFGNLNNLIREGVLREEQMQAHKLDLDDLEEEYESFFLGGCEG